MTAADPAFVEDLRLQPHPNELASAINGAHVVRFTFADARDETVTVCVAGEPLADEWPAEVGGDLNWMTIEVPAAVASQLADGEHDPEYVIQQNGARIRVRVERRADDV